MPDKSEDLLKRFDDLPDTAITPTRITAAVTGLSQRTVRYHPALPRRYVSRERYGQSVGDIRKLLRGEVPQPLQPRARLTPIANRLIQEVSAAPTRTDAERAIAAFDDSKLDDDVRELLQARLQDALAELPEATS